MHDLIDFTEDLFKKMSLEVLGYEVLIVEGDSGNFKLTTPDDLKLAKLMIEKGNN